MSIDIEKTNIIDPKAKDRLKNLIEIIENYENKKNDLNEAIKEVYNSAQNEGFNIKIIKKIIKLKKMDKSKAREEEEMLEIYKDILDLE